MQLYYSQGVNNLLFTIYWKIAGSLLIIHMMTRCKKTNAKISKNKDELPQEYPTFLSSERTEARDGY